MATLFGAFVLSYLFAVVFTDELSLSPVDRLVSYQANANFTELIPGALYNGTINVRWAVPDSALFGIDAKSVAVKITATLPENSSVFFPVGMQRARETTVYLLCNVEGGRCTNGSVLSASIPLAASARPDGAEAAKVTLRSEIVGAIPSSYQAVQQEAGSVFEALKKVFEQNSTGAYSTSDANTSSQLLALEKTGADALNFSFASAGNAAQSGNILDSLKPEGDSRDPLSFLKENPLISIFALIIVIVITGAYLLNAKD